MDHFKINKIEYLSIYPYLTLKRLTPRADSLAIAGNKPYRCCTSSVNHYDVHKLIYFPNIKI